MTKTSKSNKNVWGLEEQNLQTQKDLNRAEKMLQRQIKISKDQRQKEELTKSLKLLINGKDTRINYLDDLSFNPRYLIVNEVIKKENLDNLLEVIYKLKNYFNNSRENFFKIISKKEIEDCISSVNSWIGYSKSYTCLHPIIFNDRVKDFTDLIICFNDFTPSIVSVEFILGLRNKTRKKLTNDIREENANRNVFPNFFEIDGQKTVSTTEYADYIVKNKLFLEDVVKIKWNFLHFINEKIGLKTYLYELGIPAVSILYSKINPEYLENYSKIYLDNIPVLCGYKIPLHTNDKKCNFLFVEESNNQLIRKDYYCLNLVYSDKKDNQSIDQVWNEVLKKWFMFGQLETIFAVIFSKKQLEEEYLNKNLNVVSKAKSYRKIIKQNYDYLGKKLKYDELLESVKIYPFSKDFKSLSDNDEGIKSLSRIINNEKKLLNQINVRSEQIRNIVNQKQKIIISKYESRKNHRHAIYSGCSLIVAIIALIISLIVQWRNISLIINNIIQFFGK